MMGCACVHNRIQRPVPNIGVSKSGFSLEAVQISSVWSKMQILLTLAAKQAIYPSGFKLFEDADFVPSNEAFVYKKHHPG